MENTGWVAWFDNAKGYGFISRKNAPDIFVHFSAVSKDGWKTLQQNDSVQFSIEAGPTGKQQAVNVLKLASHSQA